MNSSPARSYALDSSSSTRSASRAVISPIRYVSILIPASSIARRTPTSGISTSRYSRSLPLLADALEQRVAQAQRHRGVADEPVRLLLRVGLGLRLDRVLGGEVVEEVLAPARLDQIREEHRVVDGVDADLLRVVRDQLAAKLARRRGATTTSAGVAIAMRPSSAATPTDAVERGQLRRFAPRDRGPRRRPAPARQARPRRDRRCARGARGTRSGGTSRGARSGRAARARAGSGRSRARGRAASSRAPSTRGPGRRTPSGSSAAPATAPPRARAPTRASRTARSAARRSCRRCPGRRGCCPRCRPSGR